MTSQKNLEIKTSVNKVSEDIMDILPICCVCGIHSWILLVSSRHTSCSIV